MVVARVWRRTSGGGADSREDKWGRGRLEGVLMFNGGRISV